jgi:hypothetical protein
MSSGFRIGGGDLYNYLQPYFAGADVSQLSGFKINGVQAFARRDNDPNNAPTASNLGYKVNGVDISQYGNRANAGLTIQITGNKIYNGQGQQANIVLISPTDSWITVQTTTVTDVGLYDSNYFSYTPPNGYILTVNFSYFSIDPSEINIISNGGPLSFTYTGGNITFSNYSVTGVFPQDTSWSVSDTDRTNVGSYYAYLSTSSQNYVVGTLDSVNWTIVPSSAPGPPIIGASSAGDKSFTANWSAPTVTGGEISGYYVSYSTNGGSTWSAESTTTSLTYTWSGNGVIYNGNSYIARVRAYNSLAIGSYSSNPTGVVPTFAAPTVQSINFAAPSTSNPNRRPFTVTLTPTSCVNYSITRIYVQNASVEFFGGYYDSVNSAYNNFYTQTTGQQTTGLVSDVLATGIFDPYPVFYIIGPSDVIKVYVITYNNDGYGVASSTITNTAPAPQTYYTYNPDPLTAGNGVQLYQTGTFNVTGNTFSQTSVTYISSNDWYVNRLSVSARTATLASSINITSTGRSFFVDFSGSTTGTFGQSLSGSQSPWNNNNASITRSLSWDVNDVNYGNNGNGRVRVRGAGTIGTWAAGQVINIVVTAFGQTRTLTYY